jgi:hypothetical protein
MTAPPPPAVECEFPGANLRGPPSGITGDKVYSLCPVTLAAFGKTLHSLSKFGQDLFFEWLPDRVRAPPAQRAEFRRQALNPPLPLPPALFY